jgi:hypothetical protein
MRHLALALVLLAAFVSPALAQAGDEPDPVAPLLARIEQALGSRSVEGYLELLASSADRKSAAEFAESIGSSGISRVAVRERDRMPLKGVLPGDGYSLLVEVFLESGLRARIATWRLDVRRRASSPDWGIADQESLTTLYGLFRLSLNPKRQISVKDLVISAEDLKLTVPDGSLFIAEADDGPTAVVVLGRGEMVFSPTPPAERSQLRVATGAEPLQTGFDGVFLRINPSDFRSSVSAHEMIDRPAVDPRDLSRADEIFQRELLNSFGLSLGDLSSETWSLLPPSGDFLADIRTRRFETLTFAKSGSEVEDISLFNRKAKRNLSVYSSREHLARFTRFYSEDQKADYIVRAYDLEVAYSPEAQRLSGHARLTVETTARSLSSFTLRLADSLKVESVVSREMGRLLCVRVRDQNSLVVNLPATLMEGFLLHLDIVYSGSIAPQPIEGESVEVLAPQERNVDEFTLPVDESYLFSNRSFWYPQPPVLNYAPADIRVTLGEPWVAVVSGQLVSVTLAPGPVERGGRRQEFTFTAKDPVRYLTLLVADLAEVKRETVPVPGRPDPAAAAGAAARVNDVELRVSTTPTQRGRGKDLAKSASDILTFYASLFGSVPYPSMTVAALAQRLPGGHSPAYVSIIGVPPVGGGLNWRDDPGALPFPDFFIAHELAHQWWGQAVGWKNYHEQWISEGFAQYSAALYAERSRGAGVFDAIIRRMQDFALDESDKGPIYLGYRIGHAKGDSRLFRAVVYNKGAMVLHTLRRLIGDDAFFGGLRRFYGTWRFKKAGTDDLRRAMELESGRDLRRFFDQWVLGETVPQVGFAWSFEELDGAAMVVVRFDQAGEVFDVPVTVTVEYEDRKISNSTVILTEKSQEARIPVSRKVRRVEVNRDRAAVGVFRPVDSRQ